MTRFSATALFFFLRVLVSAQVGFPDSLYQELRNASADSQRIGIHIAIADHYGWDAADSAFSHGLAAKSISEKTESPHGLFLSCITIASACYVTGDFARGLDEASTALEIARKQKRTDWERRALSKIGLLYLQAGKYEDGLECFSSLLSMTDSAMYPVNYATVLNNIANCYLHLKNYEPSLRYRRRAIVLREKSGDISMIGDSYNDLGETYIATGNYDSALIYLNRCLEYKTRTGDREMSAVACMNLGAAHLRLGNMQHAKEYFARAYTLSSEIGANNYRLEILRNLAEIAGRERKPDLQAQLLLHVLALKDTLYTEKSQSQINRLQAEFKAESRELKIQSLQLEREKQDALTEEQRKRSNIILLFSIVGISLLVVFLVVMTNRFRITKKQKATIELQKAMVDQKQKEVLDSINYARRIQYTLLAHDELLSKNLPEHFILFAPKDIVSGDFYWATHFGDSFYLAVCDSTGHGVPGAFMSLLNISFLNEAISEKGISSPERIFDYVRKRLSDSISAAQSESETVQDGMDGLLIRFRIDTPKISFSAAYNAPVVVRDGQVLELECDKMPVGKSERENGFSLYEFQPQSGDMLYLFTDGYADQFGGPRGKKFMYRRLKELFLHIASMSLSEQKSRLEGAYLDWKGTSEQVDDVCVIGIRFQ